MAGHGLSWVAKKTSGSSPRIPGRNYDPNLLEDIVGSSKLKRRRCGGLCVRCYSSANGLPISLDFQFLAWCIGSIDPHLSPAYRRGYTRDHSELRHALRWCLPKAPIRLGPLPVPARPRSFQNDKKLETRAFVQHGYSDSNRNVLTPLSIQLRS